MKTTLKVLCVCILGSILAVACESTDTGNKNDVNNMPKKSQTKKSESKQNAAAKEDSGFDLLF